MQLVQRSTDYTSDDPALNPPIVEGQANPMRRDTVQLPGGAGVTLRVVADNPGVWIFHCIDFAASLAFLSTDVLFRSRRMASGSRIGRDVCRSSSAHTKRHPAVHV